VYVVKEDFECNEVFTPDMNMPRVFDQTVNYITFLWNIVPSILAGTYRGSKRICFYVRRHWLWEDTCHGGEPDRSRFGVLDV
jgi:hypothetical protein